MDARGLRIATPAAPTTPAGHRNARIIWTDKIEEAILEGLVRPFGKVIV